MAGTITQLVVQKHDKERVSVFLDGEYAFSLEIMAAARLRKGEHLSDAEIALLCGRDEQLRAWQAALRILGSRPRSRVEIERALRAKDFPDEAIDYAVARLEGERLIDDADFARFWSESRAQFRPRSSRALRYELRQKGVASEDMEEALGGVDDDAAAWAAVQPRRRTYASLPPDEARRKVHAFLARRGFTYETSRRVWQRLEADEAEPAEAQSAEAQSADDDLAGDAD